jgi:hypothetical protein
MDGRVITKAISQDFLENHQLRYLKSYDTELKEKQENSITSHELEQLEARLRDLGYLG